jgi:hypothetical protein
MEAWERRGRARVDQAAVVAEIQAHVQGLVLPEWPLFALAGADGAGWLSGAGQDERGSITCVRLDSRSLGAVQRLVVQTGPDRGGTCGSGGRAEPAARCRR